MSNYPHPATGEELETVERTLRAGEARPIASIARELGWPTLRVSIALLELWARGRADVSINEPYGWRLI